MILIIDIELRVMKYKIYMNIKECQSGFINKHEINLPIRESLPLWKTSKES